MKLLLFGWGIWYLGEGMFGPLFAIFAERVGGDILDVVWARAAYLVMSGIMYIVVGRLTDKYNNKEKVMIYGYALNTLCTFGYLLVNSPVDLFVVQIWLGLASAMATPTREALYAKNEDKKNTWLQRWLAWWTAEIITWIAIVIGWYIVTYRSFTTLFVCMGIIQAVATMYQAQILKTRKRD